jgi:hypothetical protein
VALFLLLATVSFCKTALAGAIVVGEGADCSYATIQEAIDRAYELCRMGFCGYNLILVTDDVRDSVHHENLTITDMAAYPDLSIEIAGGYNNCRDLEPTAFGKASLYGGGQNRPSIRMTDVANVRLRDLWIDGGSKGIEWIGRGEVALTDVTVNHSTIGVYVSSSDGSPYLSLLGGVDIVGHDTQGIAAWGNSVITVRGDRNSIHGNGQGGIRLNTGAVVDIGASGKVVADNGGYGLAIDASGLSSARTSYLYSTNPADPLRISGNDGGAIWLLSENSDYSLCAANIGIDGNAGSAIRAAGAHARLELNSENCVIPQQPPISCPLPMGPGMCNAIAGNPGADNALLVAAVDGASILMRRVLLTNNTASTLLSTNRGETDNSASSITLTDSLVSGNTVRDDLFESQRGGIVDIWDSTVRLNSGTFQTSFIGIAPGLMQMTNSILDQEQDLVALAGTNGSTTHFTHVLARNTNGAPKGNDILLGQPSYLDGGIGQLAPTSPGVDYAPAGGGVDFGGHPRDVDTLGLPNQFGPRDLGAFESQVVVFDRIFASGLERFQQP